jgi:hypothetical protein
MRHAAVVVAALAALAACKGKQREQINGLGKYRFGHTTRADIRSNGATQCQPTELSDGRKATWCFALDPIMVGKRPANVSAYFLGADPPLLPEGATEDQIDARRAQLAKEPLIELQLQIRGCDEQQTEQWLRQLYGGADADSKGTQLYWHNDFQAIVAELPSEPGRCIVHLLPASETSEVTRLKAKVAPPAPAPPP